MQADEYAVGPASGRHAWERQLSDTFLPGRVSDMSPNGLNAIKCLDEHSGHVVAALDISPQKIEHGRQHCGGPRVCSKEKILIHVVSEGRGVMAQGGVEWAFDAGDVSFRDQGEPSLVSFWEQSKIYVIQLDKDRFLGGARQFVPKVIARAERLRVFPRAHQPGTRLASYLA